MTEKPSKQQELFPDELAAERKKLEAKQQKQAAKREKLYTLTLGKLAEIVAFSKGLSVPEIHVSLQKAFDETLDKLHERKER